MAGYREIHWVAPAIMLGSLTTGILFAIGHHCFYQDLNGTVASESFILGSISYQQANIAIGTALAFIVKSFLVLAVATAFIQVFWKVSSEQQRISAHTVRQLDVLYSGLNNAFALAHIRIWSRCLMLLGLSAIAWLIPIASIITPATLSIRSAPFEVTTATEVPNLDFGSFNFLADMPTSDGENHFSYAGPQTEVLTITNSVLSGGSILAMEPPGANSSWVLEFSGPSLRCEKVNETTKDRFIDNYVDAHATNGTKDSGPLCYSPSYGYYAWSPRYNYSGPSDLPFLGHQNASLVSLHFAPGTLTNRYASDAIAVPAIYIMTVPSYSNSKGWTGCPWNDTTASPTYDGTILQCQLFNSTYRSSFNYTNGNQKVNIEVLEREDQPQSSIIWGMSLPWFYAGNPFVWCPDLNTTNFPSGPGPAPNPLYTGSKHHAPSSELCGTFNRKLLQALSYQAVFDAFSSALTGVAPSIPAIASYLPWRSYLQSKVMETRLIQNKDLDFLTTSQGGHEGYAMLLERASSLNDTNVMGLLNQRDQISDRPLGDEIERMFRDVTVSLMSSKHLRLNYSSNFAPPPPNVTHHKYHNVYTYSAWKLWTAYAIAILFAAIAVIIGLETILSAGVSYSDKFSTIFRIARGAEVSRPILEKDLDGKDPLPDYMAGSEVHFQLRQQQTGAYQVVKGDKVDR